MTVPKKARTALDETNQVSGEFVRRDAAWRNWIRNGKKMELNCDKWNDKVKLAHGGGASFFKFFLFQIPMPNFQPKQDGIICTWHMRVLGHIEL
jgi:hypothetical protein